MEISMKVPISNTPAIAVEPVLGTVNYCNIVRTCKWIDIHLIYKNDILYFIAEIKIIPTSKKEQNDLEIGYEVVIVDNIKCTNQYIWQKLRNSEKKKLRKQIIQHVTDNCA